MGWQENMPEPHPECIHDVYLTEKTTMEDTGYSVNISTAGTFPILQCRVCKARYCDAWGYEQN
ncbi:hypothetical protein [Clostridium weizhouense]|uniref:Uncharacterized protein n=1 Tax=Clostridium weizhouense TaxID=2859781 RepID=A0ABS7ASN0_9CLOT|nr:hypothetical protein [Clostridium weizhouense]MBW6411682.1 hypothetical protein [Clostridium weizhouense]